MSKRMSLTFDVSAAPFVVRCFGYRVVDGKLKKPGSLEYMDVTCGVCRKVIQTPEEVGGFFDDESQVKICCNSSACLIMAEK